MKILRLLLFEDCNRSCAGCCNRQWDLKNLPVCGSFEDYEMIMLTGGEPMLNPTLIMKTVARIKRKSNAKIILYTAKIDALEALSMLMCVLDGITVTLHDQSDASRFLDLYIYLGDWPHKTLRLNIFKGVELGFIPKYQWKVKDNIEWIEDCPLPENEVFMRLARPISNED